jgi:hypothetical protein
MVERGASLGEYNWQLPPLDATSGVTILRAAMLALVVVGVAWVLRGLVRRFAPVTPGPGTSAS